MENHRLPRRVMKYEPPGRRNDQECGRILTRNRSWAYIMKKMIKNYWVFGLCPSSDMLETRKHLSEIGSVSVIR
jgi:hypothetical protein